MTGTPREHILVVDDDDRLRDLLQRYLSENGFMVSVARDAADAEQKLASLQFDLMVLDIMMPGEPGLSFAARLKHEAQNPMPILLLTAMGEPEDRIGGLESGADDYLTKPFEPRELLLRIRAILRRLDQSRETSRADVRFGPYRYVLANGKLSQGETTVYLTRQEQDVLHKLAQTPGQPVSRDALADAAGMDGANERSVDVQINRLRKKIEPVPGKPLYVQTARGAGYVLQVDTP